MVGERSVGLRRWGVNPAGDIRSGSPRQIATAVGDGAIAGISAEKLLRELSRNE